MPNNPATLYTPAIPHGNTWHHANGVSSATHRGVAYNTPGAPSIPNSNFAEKRHGPNHAYTKHLYGIIR